MFVFLWGDTRLRKSRIINRVCDIRVRVFVLFIDKSLVLPCNFSEKKYFSKYENYSSKQKFPQFWRCLYVDEQFIHLTKAYGRALSITLIERSISNTLRDNIQNIHGQGTQRNLEKNKTSCWPYKQRMQLKLFWALQI